MVAAAGLFVGSLFLLSAIMGSIPEESTGCDTVLAGSSAPTGSAADVGDLTSGQLANVDAIIREGRRRHVPVQGIVIALAVASQESHFTNYANDGRGADIGFFQAGVARSLQLPHEAVGSDHGSVGVFQQQWPWWGSLAVLMDPSQSAGRFYESLLKVPGWESMPVTVAAQRVQRSAYPDAYADDEHLARQLLGDTGQVSSTRSADWSPSSAPGCTAGAARGPVVYPLPKSSGYSDNHNWGHRSSHWASVHTGTDLSVACGTPVLAATAGTIVIRTDQPWAGRWLVQVSTGVGQLTTWYGHMRQLDVIEGQQVAAGEQIGQVGDLGNATGCHLHFEVHPQGGSIYRDNVDPSAWLTEHVGRERSGTEPVDLSGGGEDGFTLATFNTLGNSHTAAGGKAAALASGAERSKGVVDLLDQYGVDVVGFQEFQSAQARAFATLAGDRYQTYSAPGDSENAIAWRRDRWEFVLGRTFAVPYFNGHQRQMPIVRLRDASTGQEAVFVNVHNPADTRAFPRQARWRAAAVDKEVAALQRLSGGGDPVFLTGDMNDRREVFCSVTASGRWIAANGGHSRPECQLPTKPGIDWIFGPESISFTGHTTDRAPLRNGTSDHPFVVSRVRGGS